MVRSLNYIVSDKNKMQINVYSWPALGKEQAERKG